ncbi:hypothetical protein MFM001_45670 [Mycobacterium sp. MFM001]|uniref:hypothetical protein n=1 Tax=Mycobacterium sp. MFM001 TaxID=2049453 RepID=UPI000DA5DDA8|nr:hypothetical protein [Mycobacterium sp. MFM001]GBE68105.1 hypothetical protein MFM001_45670 [Mycobacterium sp. MFM001]
MLLVVTSKPLALAAAALLLAGWGATSGVATADPTPSPQPHQPGPKQPGPGPGPAQPEPGQPQAQGQPKTTIDHDGKYVVGTDIAPGVYTSAGPVNKGACYWKRLGAGDNGSEILDSAMTKKPQVVQIEASDKAFKTDGCQPWQKNDSATPDTGRSPAETKAGMDILNGILNGAQPPKS